MSGLLDMISQMPLKSSRPKPPPMSFNDRVQAARGTSTITGQPQETLAEKMEKVKALIEKMIGMGQAGGRIAAEFAPGSGDLLDVMDTLDYGKQAESSLGSGNYMDALKNYGMGAVASLGVLPLIGDIPKAARKVGRAISGVADMRKPIKNIIKNDLGEPLRVLHGTSTDYNAHEPKYGGTYFTTDADVAESFMRPNIYEGGVNDFNLTSKKPFDARWKKMGDEEKTLLRDTINSVVDNNYVDEIRAGHNLPDDWDAFEAYTDGEFFEYFGRDLQDDIHEKLFGRGYDSIIFPDNIATGTPHTSYVVNNPNQIIKGIK